SEDTGGEDAEASEDSGDDSDSEDDSEDAADSENDSEESGDDSDDEDSVDMDNDEDNSSIGIGGTGDLDEQDIDEESSDDAADEDATSGGEQTKTFVLEENGTYNELVYYYVGDEVTRQTSVTEMDYEAIGASNEEEAKELLSEASKEYTDTD
ncbi:DUF1307 domain-containing protein, partial [Acinetobacter baumannii]|uniref:DUF1307 domain-containing protein n=1 Tax=Acinetobacter baumannii TaxID=470 RepID=UPI00189C5567